MCPNWVALSLVPVSEHALYHQPQLLIAYMMRPVAVTTNRVWGVLNIDIVVSSLNNLPDMVTLLRLVGPPHYWLSGVFSRERLNSTHKVTKVYWSLFLPLQSGLLGVGSFLRPARDV